MSVRDYFSAQTLEHRELAVHHSRRAMQWQTQKEAYTAILKERNCGPSTSIPCLPERSNRCSCGVTTETMVFRAFKGVEVRVQTRAGFGNEAYGRDLMVKAFGEKRPANRPQRSKQRTSSVAS